MLTKGPETYRCYRYRPAPSELVARADQIAALCRQYDVPLAAAALQFSLRDPRVASTIVGMTRVERIDQMVSLATHPIPDEPWARLDRLALFGRPRLIRAARALVPRAAPEARAKARSE